jgi:hypothetical protein
MDKIELSIRKSAWTKECTRESYPCTFVGEQLAVLRWVTWTGQEKRKWQVSHRPTGYLIAYDLPTKRAAIELAVAVERRCKRLGIDLTVADIEHFQAHPNRPTLHKYVRRRSDELRASV